MLRYISFMLYVCGFKHGCFCSGFWGSLARLVFEAFETFEADEWDLWTAWHGTMTMYT